MAQDESYQTTVYFQQGGNRLVAGSGGAFAVESGGSMQVADSAALILASGATLSIVTGASIALAGTGFSPEELTRLIVSNQLMDSNQFAAAAANLSISNLPKNLLVYMITASAAANVVDASFWLTSVSAGREVWLGLVGDSTGTFTNALTTCRVSTSGCIIIGSDGTYLSRFDMNASVGSDVMVHLISPFEDVWAIATARGDVDERLNA